MTPTAAQPRAKRGNVKKSGPAKAATHEAKGDAHTAIGRHDKALASYTKALECDPKRPELYDKVIAAHEKASHDWDEADFALSVSWAMRKKELLDPAFRRIHARDDAGFQETLILIRQLMKATSLAEETRLVESIRERGEDAVYPLIDFLLSLKFRKKTTPVPPPP